MSKPTKIRPVIFMCYKYTLCLKLPLAELEKKWMKFFITRNRFGFYILKHKVESLILTVIDIFVCYYTLNFAYKTRKF